MLFLLESNMTFTENSEFAMQNEKRYVYFIFLSLFLNNGLISIYSVNVHVFDHVLHNFFIRDISNYHILYKCNTKTMIITALTIVLVGHANAVCVCTWYGDWRGLTCLRFRFTRWLNSLAWGQTNKTIYSWNWDGIMNTFFNDYAMLLF